MSAAGNGRLVARTRGRHAAIHGLLAAGHSERDTARILGLARGTVHRFAAAATPEQLLVKATTRPGKLDRYKPYLRQRWNEGITSAAALHAELQAKGWQGSVQAVERYVRPFRAMTAAPPPGPVIPSTRRITRWLLSRPDTLQASEQAELTGVLDRCPHLHALAGHVRSFAEIMTRRRGQHDLDRWLIAVEAGDLPELHSFAAASAVTSRPSPTGSPCPTAPPPWKAPSPRSRCSNGRCTAAPASPCFASAPSSTPDNSHHGIRSRAWKVRQSQS